MTEAIVIGAGISGLSAAYALHRDGLKVTVLEAGAHAGGLIRSVAEQGYVMEAGPHTFPTTAQAIQALCQQLELLPQQAHAAKKRYLYLNGRLQALPASMKEAVFSPLLSVKGKLTLVEGLFRKRMDGEDPTVAEFVRYYLGDEVLENLVDPFISGVYAGNVSDLSMAAVFPRLWDAHQGDGSLLSGLKVKKGPGPARPRYGLQSFPGGLQVLTDALAKALPKNSIRLKTSVESIRKTVTGFEVHTRRGTTLAAPRLILAVPAGVAAELLAAECPRASDALARIPYEGLAVMHAAFDRAEMGRMLDGFGFLVPRREHMPLLGCIWASSLFPDRCPPDQVLTANFVGGAHQPGVVNWSEASIEAQVVEDLSKVFGKPMTPTYSRVEVYAQGIPQYVQGHRERVAEIEQAVSLVPGLALAGNYLHGIALNECVLSGQRAAEAVRNLPEA